MYILCCWETPGGRSFLGPEFKSAPDPNPGCGPALPSCGAGGARDGLPQRRVPRVHDPDAGRLTSFRSWLAAPCQGGGGGGGEDRAAGSSGAPPTLESGAEAAGSSSTLDCDQGVQSFLGGKCPLRSWLGSVVGRAAEGKEGRHPNSCSSGLLFLGRKRTQAPLDLLGKRQRVLASGAGRSPRLVTVRLGSGACCPASSPPGLGCPPLQSQTFPH